MQSMVDDNTSNSLGFFYFIIVFPLIRYLATTSADQTAKLWRTSDFTLHSTLQTENQRWVWDIAFSADSQYAITGWCLKFFSSLTLLFL